MEAWQDRVIAEKRELDEKIVKIVAFIESSAAFPSLPAEDQRLLRDQLAAMSDYGEALRLRIARFK